MCSPLASGARRYPMVLCLGVPSSAGRMSWRRTMLDQGVLWCSHSALQLATGTTAHNTAAVYHDIPAESGFGVVFCAWLATAASCGQPSRSSAGVVKPWILDAHLNDTP
jgi:hypothetical protein